MGSYFKYKNKYFISANSSLADDRTMVLKNEDCFGVFDRYGDIHPIGQGAQGLYFEGTRFLSLMELLINGERPIMLSSSIKQENELLTVDMTNADVIESSKIIIEKGSLHLHRTKFIWKNVCYEKIRLSNFGIEPLTFKLTLEVNADFSDIFEVRGIKRKKKGKRLADVVEDNNIHMEYMGLDRVKRKTGVRFETRPTSIADKQALYEFCLLPKAQEDLHVAISFQTGESALEVLDFEAAYGQMVNELDSRKKNSCTILSGNEQFNEWLARSKADMATMVSHTEQGLYPYAGIPWYSTPFGRDGIITAWECLWINPELTKGVLQYLAATQAQQLNAFQDAQPGKIFHEKRGGEMAALGEIPFKLYYGTIDATPLFIGLAGAYYERTNDLETIRKIWPNILAALEWIDLYGDLDGDGFIEYQCQSEKGLVNQGWKDSHDSIFHADGKLAEGAIALCEVQGYVYDAKCKAAKLAEAMGAHERAAEWRLQAEVLKQKFNSAFWSTEKNTFVIALDGQKNQCNISTSNAGHCLFSGIVDKEKSIKLAKTLLDDKIFSSWGIRTAACDEARYNPMSYHNGSVWPHDNALIAHGLARYGYREEVNRILRGLFDVTIFVEANRLPELFCGFNKRKNEGPIAYPVACSPQAWAVAAVYMLLQACLGISIIARENTIYFRNPVLPDFLDEVTISNLDVNGSKLALQVRRNIEGTSVHVLHSEGNVHVEVIGSTVGEMMPV